MNISDIANQLNGLSKNHKIDCLQNYRKDLKNLKRNPAKNIFSTKTIFNERDYAFHFGGRSEMQFNISWESDSKLFRYGLAFSLDPSQTLKDPKNTLKPKILKFNDFIKRRHKEFSDLKLWYYEHGKRSENIDLSDIPENLIENGNFIFIGKYFNKHYNFLSTSDLEKILLLFDRMLEIYLFVESDEKRIMVYPEKIARICWNSENWQKPSGREGKSKDTKSYEYKTGFGHEEWLLDTSKVINKYHYGFLQQISHNRKKYEGEIFNISLYSINSKTKDRYWIGKIKSAEIVSFSESKDIYRQYVMNRWFNEMIHQLKNVDASTEAFKNNVPEDFVNLKFKLDNLEIFDEPLLIDKKDTSIKSTHYSSLLNKIKEPKVIEYDTSRFVFKSGHNLGKEGSVQSYQKSTRKIDFNHNTIQNNVFEQLCSSHGKNNVGTENSGVDIVVKKDSSHIFYEIKTSNSIKICIREAIGQLLEYSFWPDSDNAIQLIIVSQNKINDPAKKYLRKLREEFNIPIYYQRYNPENAFLESELF